MEKNHRNEDKVIPLGDRSSTSVLLPGPSHCLSFRSIDISEAQKVPGFVCFVSADDIPGSNKTGLFNDETIFAKDKVCPELLKIWS